LRSFVMNFVGLSGKIKHEVNQRPRNISGS
jgi:hypothetical protein